MQTGGGAAEPRGRRRCLSSFELFLALPHPTPARHNSRRACTDKSVLAVVNLTPRDTVVHAVGTLFAPISKVRVTQNIHQHLPQGFAGRIISMEFG